MAGEVKKCGRKNTGYGTSTREKWSGKMYLSSSPKTTTATRFHRCRLRPTALLHERGKRMAGRGACACRLHGGRLAACRSQRGRQGPPPSVDASVDAACSVLVYAKDEWLVVVHANDDKGLSSSPRPIGYYF